MGTAPGAVRVPGLKPDETGQLMLVRSDDDGAYLVQADKHHRTSQKARSGVSFCRGRVKESQCGMVPSFSLPSNQDPPNEKNKLAHRLPHSTTIYSKDHGKTWQAGTGAFDDTTESQVVEIKPGVLDAQLPLQPKKSVRVVMDDPRHGKDVAEAHDFTNEH